MAVRNGIAAILTIAHWTKNFTGNRMVWAWIKPIGSGYWEFDATWQPPGILNGWQCG